MLWSALGCSRATRLPSEAIIQADSENSSTTLSRNTSIEELEQDSDFMSDQDPELRAIALAKVWHKRGTEEERRSYSGAFAAYSRSAHIAIKHLLGDTCQTPFHSPCHELDRTYKRSIDALARLLAQHSWSAPDLERSRYRLTADSIQALNSLREWQISFDQPSYEDHQTQLTRARLDASRPGLGLATVGCRQMQDSGTTCSPLTFVMTFSEVPHSETSEVSFSAFDSLQREVITIGARSIPLAAALEQAALTIGTLAANAPTTSLYCLSSPTLNTTTVLFFVEASDAVASSRSILSRLLRDSAFTNRTSLCLHTLPSATDRDISLRSIDASLRRAHAGVSGGSLGRAHRHPLSIVAIGQRPAQTALAFANRISRLNSPLLRRSSEGLRVIPESLIIISTSSQGDIFPADATDLPTYYYNVPCNHECLRGIKNSSLVDISQSELSDDLSDAKQKIEKEDIRLSPVI
jgi:hypothetical protein